MPDRPRRIIRLFYRIVDAVSFNNKIRDLAEGLSRKTEESEEVTPDLISHPGGFTRAFYKRRIGMAESYSRIAQRLGRSNYQERLHALKTLMELSFHAKTVSMPLNTARIQIEIMKEAVKNLNNRRRQMEMIADFSEASYGRPATIRRFLRELKRVEVPETGRPLRTLDLGWDPHVHDNLSEGRKTPSQVILDAFIKGISQVTLAYYDLPQREIIQEAMEAGRILGIDVTIGIEFSVGPRRERRHFFFIPPQDGTPAGFIDYFNTNCKSLSTFVDGLEENRNRRRQVIHEILDNFNRTHLIVLNQSYPEESIFALAPLKFENLEKIVPHGQYSRFHLSELLYDRLKKVLHRRVVSLKTQYEVGLRLFKKGFMTGWELERIEEACTGTRKQYIRLNPGDVRARYFSGKNITDYDSAFPEEEYILPELKAAGGTIVYNCPLEHGLSRTIETVINACEYIDRIELMNMRDSIERDPAEITRLSHFVDMINNGHLAELKLFVREWHEGGLDESRIRKALEKYHDTPLIPLVSSASTGWTPRAPGMGFIRQSSIPAKHLKDFSETHYRLPRPVAALLLGQGKPSEEVRSGKEDVFSLGKSGHFKPNLVGDEELFIAGIGFRRIWRYLNPMLKNIIRIIIGIIPAVFWFKYVRPVDNPLHTSLFYPVLWFCITFFRNVFVDLIAWSGFRVRNWSIKGVDLNNATQSLLWTGFSVPILGGVKIGFDAFWPLAHEGLVFEWTKFLLICLANGLYISTHNTLRGFDRTVIRANFFRSILSWPFSAVFAPLGNILAVPSIVQAKFWSDVIAAVIEGSSKFRQMVILRKRDLLEILPRLRSDVREQRITAMLDILYIWAVRHRGQTCLAQMLLENDGFFGRIRKIFRRGSLVVSPEKQKQREFGADSLELMLEIFKPHQAQFEMTRFVLRKYREREIIVLAELISGNLVPFYGWLKRLQKKCRARGICSMPPPETEAAEMSAINPDMPPDTSGHMDSDEQKRETV